MLHVLVYGMHYCELQKLRLQDTEVGMVRGQDGPILGGCVYYATAAKHEGLLERHNTNMHSDKQ